MSPVLIILLVIVAGIIAFFAGRWHGLKTGTKELTEELKSKDNELDQLKSGVNEHFDETARLFSNLTEEYKTLYQHLASGANKLSSSDFKLNLSAPVGSEALPSNTSAAEVIDAEEELAKQEVKSQQENSTDDGQYEEEVFVKDADASEQSIEQVKAEVSDDTAQPDIDIEVTPPKDWADDDMDDDYHPNESGSRESQFTDLSKEGSKKDDDLSFVTEAERERHSEKDNKTTTE